MDYETILLKLMDQVSPQMNIVPPDPEEHYTKLIRGEFRDAYQAGLIDCIPEVICNFNSATGDLNVHVKFPPKKTDSIQVKVTYDNEKFSY